MKIDSCLIIKNEEQNIERLINQLLIFSNEIHITDTGSTDNTIQIIEDFQKSYSNVFLHHFEWCMDFAKARNYSLTCYECNADYQFWCDGDDELNDELIKTLCNFSDENNDDIYILNYLYSENFIQKRDSLIKVSANLKWQDPIHEFLLIDENIIRNYEYFNNGSLLIHHYHPEDHPNRNLDIFMNMEKENYDFSARNRFYFGRELYHKEYYEYALYQFQKCIDERYNNNVNVTDIINACIFMFYINGDIALQNFFKLFSDERFIRKDLFYIVADYYFHKNNFILSKFYYILCINCDEPNNYILFNYDSKCHINALLQLGIILYNMNDIDKSIYYNEEILKINPNHKIALNNIAILNDLKNNK